MKYCILNENIEIPDELLQEFEETTGRPISEAKLMYMVDCAKNDDPNNIKGEVIQHIKDYIEMTKQMPEVSKKIIQRIQ